jgi:hypothetical protein
LKTLVAHLPKAMNAELKETLGQSRIHGGLWKIISRSCHSILFNHHDSPIFNNILVKYLNIVHAHLAQYNNQQVPT